MGAANVIEDVLRTIDWPNADDPVMDATAALVAAIGDMSPEDQAELIGGKVVHSSINPRTSDQLVWVVGHTMLRKTEER